MIQTNIETVRLDNNRDHALNTDDPLELVDPPGDKVRNNYEGHSQTLIIIVNDKSQYSPPNGSPQQEEQSDGQDETKVR